MENAAAPKQRRKARRTVAGSEEIGTAVDAYVGSRISLQRNIRGLSQGAVAKVLGISFQQIQKYERGANRVSASKLFMLSRLLQVSPGWFFEGIGPNGEIPERDLPLVAEGGRPPEGRRETLELFRNFEKLPPGHKADILRLAHALADSSRPGVGRE